MKRKLPRKFTSILLIVILTSSVSSTVPVSTHDAYASHNQNLYVSAENSLFNNYLSGPQVVEVIVRDSSISRLDSSFGEPDVTINGKKLRMAQATDGNWYAYFADRTRASIADSTVGLVGKGLDYGTFCSRTTQVLGVSVSDTEGIAIPLYGTGVGGENGTSSASQITSDCDFSEPKSKGALNVVRAAKELNKGGSIISKGQIGLASADLWPFVQLYDFTVGGNVIIKYNKGGGTQTVTLTFNVADQFGGLELDRSKYPRTADVHVTITDLNLNIDPTDEDSWSFGTLPSNPSVYYRLFTDTGNIEADGTEGAVNLQSFLNLLMFKDKGVLKINPGSQGDSNIITIRDNKDSKTNGNGVLSISSVSTDGDSISAGNQPVTLTETEANSAIFTTFDESNNSILVITENAYRGKSATIEYNKKSQSILTGFSSATINMDETVVGNEWNSGEKLPLVLIDADANKNKKTKENLNLNNPQVGSIPSLKTGNPFTLGNSGIESSTKIKATFLSDFTLTPGSTTGKFLIDTLPAVGTTATVNKVERFSERAIITPASTSDVKALVIDLRTNGEQLLNSINSPFDNKQGKFKGLNMFNYDVRSLNNTLQNVNVYLLVNQSAPGNIINDVDGSMVKDLVAISLANTSPLKNLVNLNSTKHVSSPASLHSLLFDSDLKGSYKIGLMFTFSEIKNIGTNQRPIVSDFFSYGFTEDGISKENRIANQIIRLELEETSTDSGNFRGSLEYVLLNQLNILDNATFEKLATIDNDVSFALIDRAAGKDAPRVDYNDVNQDGSFVSISDQQDALTHTGIPSLSAASFKAGDTVKITLDDKDLNVDADIVDVYTVVDPNKFPADPAVDSIGKANLGTTSDGNPFGILLEVTIGNERWIKSTVEYKGKKCSSTISGSDGLFSTGFTLIETSKTSGIFTGEFKIPLQYCSRNQGGVIVSATGADIQARYYDFRDNSGQLVRTGTTSSVGAASGTVSLDRTVYPVPIGSVKDFFSGGKSDSTSPNSRSIFPVHKTGITKNGDANAIDSASEEIGSKDVIIRVRVFDPDFNQSPKGSDTIAQKLQGDQFGPVKVAVSRGTSSVVLATAGADTVNTGVITFGKEAKGGITRELGPIKEVSPESGIFQFDLPLRYTDGPPSTICPSTQSFTPLDKTKSGVTSRFDTSPSTGNYCILKGDVLTVEYTDPTDASGQKRKVSDSATFDMRNGVLQSDKSVYIIGSDMILTLIDPDLDLDTNTAETHKLDLIEWSSDAGRATLGVLGGAATQGGKIFDPEPSGLRETGKSSGIFQTVIEIPQSIGGKNLDRGERIKLEYVDWSSSSGKFVGDNNAEVKHSIFTSNFGATIELDKKLYTWTDRVFIAIVAPDYNFDSKRIDEIGNTSDNEVTVSTRASQLKQYKLVESGTDTGVFVGEVILTGFKHDADGNPISGDNGIDTSPRTTPKSGGGPTNGFLESRDNDGLTVSFKSGNDQTVIGAALIRWEVGQISWMKGINLKEGVGTVVVKDPDMNLNPKNIDTFKVGVWSDSDVGGIHLSVTETGISTGEFTGNVFFTTTEQSSGNRLRVSEGDFVTAQYEDNTLPPPYSKSGKLRMQAATYIGSIIPPLERAPVSNISIVDLSGSPVTNLNSGKQIQIKADITNAQKIIQPFAYILQIKNEEDVTVSLSWFTGTLAAEQSLTTSISWTPDRAGKFTGTIFVWENLDSPLALSPYQSFPINVS